MVLDFVRPLVCSETLNTELLYQFNSVLERYVVYFSNTLGYSAMLNLIDLSIFFLIFNNKHCAQTRIVPSIKGSDSVIEFSWATTFSRV